MIFLDNLENNTAMDLPSIVVIPQDEEEEFCSDTLMEVAEIDQETFSKCLVSTLYRNNNNTSYKKFVTFC